MKNEMKIILKLTRLFHSSQLEYYNEFSFSDSFFIHFRIVLKWKLFHLVTTITLYVEITKMYKIKSFWFNLYNNKNKKPKPLNHLIIIRCHRNRLFVINLASFKIYVNMKKKITPYCVFLCDATKKILKRLKFSCNS